MADIYPLSKSLNPLFRDMNLKIFIRRSFCLHFIVVKFIFMPYLLSTDTLSDILFACGNLFTDCCDGSDEYDGSIKCRNTCIMGGNIVYQKQKYDSESNQDSINSRKTKPGNQMDDSSQKLKGISLRARLLYDSGIYHFI